ncbi:MAG TPA: tyrosine-type recombinase/integrase, partial [Jatrophihabitantaceae bacterium]
AHTVRFHDLRHAHASWLLAGGADIQTVKERLGHGSLRTTEKYLHTLPTPTTPHSTRSTAPEPGHEPGTTATNQTAGSSNHLGATSGRRTRSGRS